MERSKWDYPVTDTELDNFYGQEIVDMDEQTAAPLCRYIRKIGKHDFTPQVAAKIIAALSSKLAESDYKDQGFCVSAIESLDSAFDDLGGK